MNTSWEVTTPSYILTYGTQNLYPTNLWDSALKVWVILTGSNPNNARLFCHNTFFFLSERKESTRTVNYSPYLLERMQVALICNKNKTFQWDIGRGLSVSFPCWRLFSNLTNTCNSQGSPSNKIELGWSQCQWAAALQKESLVTGTKKVHQWSQDIYILQSHE